MHETVLTVFTVTAMLGLDQPAAAARRAVFDPVQRAAGAGRDRDRRRDPHSPALSAWRCGPRHHRHVAQFRAQRRVASVHLFAGAAVRCGAQRRCPTIGRRGRAGAAARGHRRRRLHPCRRLCAVAAGTGRRARLHHPRRDHRHHRSRPRSSPSFAISGRRAACRPWCRARACSTTRRRSRSIRSPSRS